jgi:Peptidase family M28
MFPSYCLAAALAAPFAAEGELSEEIRAAELKAHVYRLASPEFLGRKGPGGVRASEHIAAAFKMLGLEPAFGSSYFQPIPWLLGDPGKAESIGRNVGAVLRGSDPALRDEWIILTAHFDHLGTAGELLFPGADDNASGVAMLLEVAERFALRKAKPKRTILFVSFDLEEQGLQGASHFAAHPPRPFDKLKAFLVADLLGRSMAGLDDAVFALGSESSEQLRTVVSDVKPESGLTVGRLGADLVGTRSDYGPFRDRKVPFLFFTTGTHRDYHRPTDRPEKIDYEKLARISRWIADVTQRLADDPSAPVWSPRSETDLDEARTVFRLLDRLLERSEEFPLTEEKRTVVTSARDRLRAIVGRGQVSGEERAWLVKTARYLMATVF